MRIFAAHDTPLSEGDGTNSLFGVASVGDSDWVDLAADWGYHPSYVVPGIRGASLALDSSGSAGTYEDTGAPLTVGLVGTDPERIWVRFDARTMPPPKLVLPSRGMVDPTVTAHAGVAVGAVGTTTGVTGATGQFYLTGSGYSRTPSVGTIHSNGFESLDSFSLVVSAGGSESVMASGVSAGSAVFGAATITPYNGQDYVTLILRHVSEGDSSIDVHLPTGYVFTGGTVWVSGIIQVVNESGFGTAYLKSDDSTGLSLDGAAFTGVSGNAGLSAIGAVHDPLYDVFTGTAGDAPDSAWWDVATYGSGTVTLDGSGNVSIYSAATTDGSLLYMKQPVVYNTSHTYKVKLRADSSKTCQNFNVGILDHDHALTSYNGSNGHPTSTTDSFGLANASNFTDAQNGDVHRRIGIIITDSAGALKAQIYRAATYGSTGEDAGRFWNGSAWATGATNFSLAYDTDYVAVITTTSTTFTLAVKSADESTTICSVSGALWSKVRPFVSSTQLLYAGDISGTANTSKVLIDWVKVY